MAFFMTTPPPVFLSPLHAGTKEAASTGTGSTAGAGEPRTCFFHSPNAFVVGVLFVGCGWVDASSLPVFCREPLEKSGARGHSLTHLPAHAFARDALHRTTALSSIFKALVLDGSNTVSSKHFLGFLSRSGIQKHDPRIKSIVACVFTCFSHSEYSIYLCRV